jgi:caspase 7
MLMGFECFSVSQENHWLSDCLLVAVLTHGGKGELFAYDHTYDSDRLWMNFTANRCPSLAGKPKIFIVQVLFFLFLKPRP